MSGFAVVHDVDADLTLPVPRRMLIRLDGLLARRSSDRRSGWGMPWALRQLAADLPDAPLHYLTAAPPRLGRRVEQRLASDGYPDGTVLCTGQDRSLRWLVGEDRAAKRRAVTALVQARPDVRWVLVGDDAGSAPDAYAHVAAAAPDRVAAIALRDVAVHDGSAPAVVVPRPVPVVRAPSASELMAQLRTAARLRPAPVDATRRWLLSAAERGNDDTDLRPMTSGNDAEALVDGAAYFAALGDALAGTGPGDLVLLLGWAVDPDRRLTADGTTLEQALLGAAGRGALVRALVWRSHLSALRYPLSRHRRLARAVAAAGGQVLLDQRIRPLGSHHQKLVVVRSAGRPESDVAFVGGIDPAHGRGDDPRHRGDEQRVRLSREYGRRPPWHDVHLRVRGPAVADAEVVFRERWQDPAPVSRLPWHVLSDLVYGLPRRAQPLPAPLPDPPRAGTCAVQLLRTYPRRRPAYPFARRGERSVARAVATVLSRAERIVYLEDQYLWSPDVARIFASALARAPRLHLIAVVPRFPDKGGLLYRSPARLGHTAALDMIREAGGSRVQVLDVETASGAPVYVHSKACVVDDVWASIGSDNFNTRSWTHDSELTAAVVDGQRDGREPADPAGLGDGARSFARGLRLALMAEHLEVQDEDVLLDPDAAAALVQERAAALDAWHAAGGHGDRPAGRLRAHRIPDPTGEQPGTGIPGLLYRRALDPDGRPWSLRLRRSY